MKILVIEKDLNQLEHLNEVLKPNYDISVFRSIASLEKKCAAKNSEFSNKKPALIIADYQIDGKIIFDSLKKESLSHLRKTPLVIISSVHDPKILHECIERGALDFYCKPFHKAELGVKLERILNPEKGFSLGAANEKNQITFSPNNFGIEKNGEGIAQLTAKEFQIFTLLYKNPNRYLTRSEIQNAVWKDVYVGKKSFDVHLFNLGKKIIQTNIAIDFVKPDRYKMRINDK